MKAFKLRPANANFTASTKAAIMAILVLPFAAQTAAQAQTATRAPIAQYWMDIATGSLMGMDEMPQMPPGMGSLIPGMTGPTGRDGKQAKGVGNFGMTKNLMMGRWLDTALYTTRKPGGTEAIHQIPPGANVGASPLQLITPPREGLKGSSGDEVDYPERPQGRILFYWGCSAQVKTGQPRVFDMSRFSAQEYGSFMQGRSVRDRGARAEPGHAIWPNDKQNSQVVRSASMVGEHSISGDGVPPNMRFTLGPGQDFMPALQVDTAGKLTDSIRVSWQSISTARAYMLTAMSGSEGKAGGPELIIWSSSEPPESGMGLMDYVSNPNIDKWLGEKVLLPASQTQCEIPIGIFAKSDGAMLRAIAYGNEANFSHPPRPANLGANAPWAPDWVVRVRTKSMAMNALGEEANAGRRSASSRSQRPDQPEQTGQSQQQQGDDKAPSLLPGIGGVLKGLFGR